MTDSVQKMADRTAILVRRRDVLSAGDGPAPPHPRSAHIQDLNEALAIIAELAGRLSSAEELLAEARKSKKDRNFRGPEED